MTSFRTQMRYFNPYELHKLIINEYVLRRPGDTKLLDRDAIEVKTDYHVIKENHKFLWDDKDEPLTWEEQFAKRYYKKLFKEYCIADLSRYKENKVALRWRIEKEVVSGKGQFICGNKTCKEKINLRTWEVNFVYQEQQERKNALVKIRLCPPCSKKLNYHSKKREVKRIQKKKQYKEKKLETNTTTCGESSEEDKSCTISCSESGQVSHSKETVEELLWANHEPAEIKSREEEMEEYLQDLLL